MLLLILIYYILEPNILTGCYHSGRGTNSICSNKNASCVSYKYLDEHNNYIEGRGCERTVPCYNKKECMRCSDPSMDGVNVCNAISKRYSHSCYTCRSEDCAILNDLSITRTESCPDNPDQPEQCATYLNKNSVVVRGCYNTAFEFYDICQEDKENCQICDGNLCNSKSVRFFCYKCTFANKRCKYGQRENLLNECDNGPGFNNIGCYTLLRYLLH